MNKFHLVIVTFFFQLCLTNDWHWPVFFERLGNVHSIHNKWDLALRVHINLPSLEAKINKLLHKLTLLDSDFQDPEASTRTIPSRLEELNKSWKLQNKKLNLRLGNLKRRGQDLRELGQYQARKRRKRDLTPEDLMALSSKSRQFLAAAGGGLLKGIFGVAYSNDVDQVKTKISNIDARLSSDINGVRSDTHNLRSNTREMLGRHDKEIRKMEDMAHVLERKVKQNLVTDTTSFNKLKK